jgi:hypothetical protein
MATIVFSIQLINDVRLVQNEGVQNEIIVDQYKIEDGCVKFPSSEPGPSTIIPLSNIKCIVSRFRYR